MTDIRELLDKKRLDVKFDLSSTDYEPIETIGTGAYGVVCSALDRRCNKKVAVKKIPNALRAITLTKRTLREVKILQHFHHENIVAVLDMFRVEGEEDCVYIVFDLMQTDLHHIIHSKQPLTDRHVQYFLYQILRGLAYIHSAGVVHRDIKPSNFMVNADCLLKIGDFGMARSVQGESGNATSGDFFMTQYVATRWYRAPELIFSFIDYSLAVDLWSVGCVLAEMINRQYLFPGKDQICQMKLIVCYLGTPNEELMRKVSSDLVKRIIYGMGPKPPLSWSAIVPKASPAAVSMLASLLRLEPGERLTAAQALSHPYLEQFRDPPNEIFREKLDLDINLESLNDKALKQAMIDEVEAFQKRRYNLSEQAPNSGSSGLEQQAILPAPDVASRDDSDVEMLSAHMQNAGIEEDQHMLHNTDAKQRLKEKLLSNAKQSQNALVTAQRRHMEREEKRRKRTEKGLEKAKKTKVPSETVPEDMSSEDRTLLERWQILREQAERARDTNSLGDIIVQALPQGQNTEQNTPSIDSAELMNVWREAASMNGVNTDDLETDLHMNSPIVHL